MLKSSALNRLFKEVMESPYWILAFYKFIHISDPLAEVANQKAFLTGKDATCRVYISEQGINAQMSLSAEDAKSYLEWLKISPYFGDIEVKIDGYHEHVFPRLTIKYRKELVSFGKEVNMSDTGQHVEPEEWKRMLEEQKDHVLLDVRNDYEWKLGHFEGAELPPCETFRDFKEYADDLKKKVDPSKTPVMMYCTGGIRCELYSTILKEGGFEKVYQLNGGIINYGHKQGSDHWLGKLFVFDDRLSVPISEQPTPVVAQCHFCQAPTENYYNCANMDCNKLFLACPNCLQEHKGCCQDTCSSGEKLRPVQQQNAHKPFRKWHFYFDKKRTEKTPEQIAKAKAKRAKRKERRLLRKG